MKLAAFALLALVIPCANGQVKISNGSISNSTIGQPGLGAPNFFGSRRDTINPGTLPFFFTSSSFTGTASSGTNCSSGNICWVSGSLFSWGSTPASFLFNNVSYTITTTIDNQHLTVSPSPPNLVGKIFGACTGQCQNATAYDTTLYPLSDRNCITRITDRSVTNSAASIGNGTCSGGANDGSAFSSLGDYTVPVAGGGGHLFHLTKNASRCYQVANAPSIPPLSFTCEFSFGLNPADDQTMFTFTDNHTLQVQTFSADASTITSGPTTLIDFTAAGNCPGLSLFQSTGVTNASYSAQLNMDLQDNVFGVALSNMPNGIQGTPIWLFAYNKHSNTCATTNIAASPAPGAGNVYAPCVVGNCTSATPIGTLSTGVGTCWGAPYFTGTVNTSGTAVTWASGQTFTWDSRSKDIFINGTHYIISTLTDSTDLVLSGGGAGTQTGATYYLATGIHGLQMALDGSAWIISFGANGSWLNGDCAGDSATGQEVIVPIGGLVTTRVDQNSPFFHGSHSSDGIAHNLAPSFTGVNIRAYSDYSTSNFQYLSGAPPWLDIHGFWPHYCNSSTIPDDRCIWIGIADSPSTMSGCATSAVYCPAYGQGVVMGYSPGPPYPPGANPVIFVHTETCGGGNAAPTCTGGASPYFGDNSSIGTCSQNAATCGFSSVMLYQLGLDQSGNNSNDWFVFPPE